MSSVQNPSNQHVPPVPSSLNAGDHEMRTWGEINNAPPSTLPQYTPYLGLRARLSQTLINRWTILLFLIIVRLLLATKDITYDIGTAKTEALSACTSVENVGSAMASMPHYLADGVNAMAADGVTKAVNGLMEMLTLTVTGVEEMVKFYIDFLISNYVCLITFAVGGSLHAVIDVIEKVGAFMNESIGDITSSMSGDITTFQNDLNTFLSAINLGGIFGSSKSPPSINLTSFITKLQTIQIDPTTMDADLTTLNNSIPDFSQVMNFTNNVIELPFEEIKKLLNESMVGYQFDKSVFPTPEKQALTFCSDNATINDFFTGLLKVVLDARTIICIILAILALLACIPMAFREIWRWRSMQKRSILLQRQAFDPMDVINIASRPMTTTIGIKIASKFNGTKKQILVRWFIAYITSLPMLFILALGLAGLFSCFFQFILLKTIEKEVPVLANEVGDFADVVVNALNNASTAWARGANSVINDTNTKVNNDVFGWVNTSTTAINDTLNTFTDEMVAALNVTFGGTILYTPVMDLMNCLVLRKVEGIEAGLTWVKDNAYITFPQFNPDVFSLGAQASIAGNSSATSSFLSSPGDVASDDITNSIVKLTDKLQSGLNDEAIIAGSLVGIWFMFVLSALIYVFISLCRRDKTRAEGGGDNRVALSPNRPNPAQFPEFGAPVSSVYPVNSSTENYEWSQGGLEDEGKLGAVGRRSVEASVQPGHKRSSSYGYMDEKKGYETYQG
jgi:hypothetical protein